MVPFHSVLPELAGREVRYVRLGAPTGPAAAKALPADEYAYLEYYCDDLNCDCRRVFLQVVAKNQPGKVFASIGYGWETESFYRKRTPWAPDDAQGTVRGELDPLNEQSEFAQDFLDLFQRVVLDEPYRLRLRRHYQLFRKELLRRKALHRGVDSGKGDLPPTGKQKPEVGGQRTEDGAAPAGATG